MPSGTRSWNVEMSETAIRRYSGSSEWMGQTIAQMARNIAAQDPERVTHVFENTDCTVADLLADAEMLAGALQRRGLSEGDSISFQLPNWREAAVIDLAASMLGLVVVPVVPIYRNAEVAYMLADSGVKAAFFPGFYRGFDFGVMMQTLQPELPQLQYLFAVRQAESESQAQEGHSYEEMIAEQRGPERLPTVDANSVKVVLYTSGTTGRPKAVLHSHNTGPTRLKRGFEHWSDGATRDTLLMASPVTHVTGLSGLELPFYMNSRTVFMDRWDAKEALDIIDHHGVTVSLGATPFLHELLNEAREHSRTLPSLRAFACGGAEVPPKLVFQVPEVLENCRAFRVFGSSEVPLVTLGFVGESELELAATTDGKIVDYEVKVIDDDGRELDIGQEGELCIRGPAMFLGYANPEQTRASFDEDGFFATGDLGRVTADNAIVITGRKKDLINRGGEKISAKEVEDIVHQHPAISEAAVVSMPHERLGETLCAYVILHDGHSLTLEELVASVKESGVARQKIPESLMVLEDFPRTASGKIRKDQLRADIRRRLQPNS